MAPVSLPGSRRPTHDRLPNIRQLPERVANELGRLERRIRSLSVVSRLSIAWVVTALTIATVLTLDYWFDLSATSRWGALMVVLLIAVSLSVWSLRWLLFHPPLDELAAAVEEKYPEFGERLLSLVEFSLPGEPPQGQGSPMMQQLLVRETLQLVNPTDFLSVVDHARTVRRVVFAGLAAVLLAAPFFMWNENYRLLWARLLTPWNNFERASNLYFEIPEGDRVAARGEDTKIIAIPRWRNQQPEAIREVRLHWTPDGAPPENRRLAWDEGANAYSTTLSSLQRDLHYFVSAPGSRSREYHIRVVDRPAIESLNITVEPPGYSGLPAEQYSESVLEIQAFEQSRLTVQMTLNKPVRHLDLVWLELASSQRTDRGREMKATDDSPEALSLQPSTTPVAIPEHLQGKFPGWVVRSFEPCQMAADQQTATISLTALRPGRFLLHAIDEHKLTNSKEPIRSLDLRMDQPPVVEFADVNEQGTARPDEIVEIPVVATDDVEVSGLELHVKSFPEGKPLKILPGAREELGSRDVRTAFAVSLSEFGLLPEDIISVRVRATDNREVPSPHESWTHERLIRIKQDSLPYGYEAIAAERALWKSMIETLKVEVAANRSELQDIQKSAERSQNESKPFDRDPQIPKLSETQQDLISRAEKLGAVLHDHPLFAKLTPVLDQVAREDITPARDKTEQVPQTTELPAKSDVLKQAASELSEAETKLNDLLSKFDQQVALERDLFELQRLANRTEQLAQDTERYEQRRDALQIPESERTPDSPQALTPDERQQQRQKLLQQHSSLSQDLNQLLQKRPELLTAAQQALVSQLQELFDRAAELANREDQLSQTLADEAASAAQHLSPQQQQQAQLQQHAEELVADQELSQTRRLARPIDLKSFERALDELQRGDSQLAIEAQQQAANDLDRLADALERNADLPADPQAAAKELASRERQLSEQMQQQVQQEQQARQVRQQAQQQNQSLSPEQTTHEQKLADQRRDIALEQAALLAAATHFETPRRGKDTQREIVRHGQESVKHLLQDDPQQLPDTAQYALNEANQTANLLDQLAQQIGSIEERQQHALHEVRSIHDEQRHLARQTEDLRRQQSEGKPIDQLGDALRQHAQKEMELAERLANVEPLTNDSSRQPEALRIQQAAIEHLTAAATDLQQQNVANTDATQARSEQSLADLRKQLEQLPTAAETIEQASQKQAEVTQATEKAHAAGDQRMNLLHQQRDQQHLLATSLEQVETPIAPELRETAKQAAYEARDWLNRAANDPLQQPFAEQSLQRSQQALANLAEALNVNALTPAESAQQLAERQKSAALQAQKQANEPHAPPAQVATQSMDELRQQQQELASIRGSVASQTEKQAARLALVEAATTQQQVEQFAKQQPAPSPDATTPPPVPPELQQALQLAAQKQQTASEALGKFSQKLQSPESLAETPNVEQGDVNNQIAAHEPQIAELQDIAQKAEELATTQDELRKNAEAELAKHTGNPDAYKQALQPQRGAQQQLSQAVRELPRGTASLSRAAAEKSAHEVEQSIDRNQPDSALQAQIETSESLRQLARHADLQAKSLQKQAQTESNASQASPQNTMEVQNPSKTNATNQSAIAELAQRARELATEQRALAEKTSQSADPRSRDLALNHAQTEATRTSVASTDRSTPEPSPTGTPPSPESQSMSPPQPEEDRPPTRADSAAQTEPMSDPDSAQATPQSSNSPQAPTNAASQLQGMPSTSPVTSPQSATEIPSPTPEEIANTLAKVTMQQQQLALAAKNLALNTEAQTGSSSTATRKTDNFAKQTQAAARQLEDGLLESAALTGQESTQTAKQAADEFRNLPPSQGFASEEKAKTVEDLAARQSQLSQQIADLNQSLAARRLAQQRAQNSLQRQTEQLTQELQDVAESFGMQPLHQPDKAKEAQASGSSAENAQQAMQSASQNLKQSNPREAATQASTAAKALREAGKLSLSQAQSAQGQPGQQPAGQQQAGQQRPGQSDSPVPQAGAKNVAQASQQLSKIGEQLAKDEMSPLANDQGQRQSSEGKEGQGEGDPQQNMESGEGQQQAENGSPHDSQDGGQQSPGGPPKASDNLKQTASNLRQAMQQFGLPQGKPTNAQKGKPNQKSGQPNSKGTQEGENDSDFGNTDEARIVELENHLKGLSTRNWGELPGSLKTEILQATRKKPDGDYAKLIRRYFDNISTTKRPEVSGAGQPTQGATP